MSSWRALSDNLFLFEEICNVYAIKDGSKAVLIDCGSGEALDHLGELGISEVDWILHTHHHRDQCQGDYRAVAAGIRLAVPAHERRLFDQVEIFWSQKQLFDMYNVRNTYNTLTSSVSVSAVLEDYKTFRWGPYEFFVLPTPGHTVGSVTLIVKVDGKQVAFSGDLMHSAGKVHTLYDMQYNYGAADGVEAAVLSLEALRRQALQLLCPSHGNPVGNPDDAIKQTITNLRSFYSFMTAGGKCADEMDLTPITPRVLAATYACSSFYVILSDSGRALFVDYGTPNFQQFQPCNRYFEDGERVRFVEHSLERLKVQYGVSSVDVVIPSHYHDDHINGIPYLQDKLGTKVWAYKNMVEILENPRGELIGCVMPDPIKVERSFGDQESFRWAGFDFVIHYTPGHCDYHMTMFTEIDGKRIAFSGDNIWPPAGIPSLIYRNHVHQTSHQITAKRFLDFRPNVLASGHGLFQDVEPEFYDRFAENARLLTQHFDILLPEGMTNSGIQPDWTRIYPYQSVQKPGDTFELEIRMTNNLPRPVTAEVELVLPQTWISKPTCGRTELPADTEQRISFQVQIPQDYIFLYPKVVIAADVTFDGNRLGQITEAVVELIR